jgi:hypothetical protein
VQPLASSEDPVVIEEIFEDSVQALFARYQ